MTQPYDQEDTLVQTRSPDWQPPKHVLVMVLSDGETFTGLEGCTIRMVPFGSTEVPPDAPVVAQFLSSAPVLPVKVMTRKVLP